MGTSLSRGDSCRSEENLSIDAHNKINGLAEQYALFISEANVPHHTVDGLNHRLFNSCWIIWQLSRMFGALPQL